VNLLTFNVQRKPGFRLNLTDLILVVLLLGISFALYKLIPDMSLYGIPLYVGFSFFCFCNIFRIGNKLEPFWYVPFFLVAAFCIYTFNMPLFWSLVLFILEPWKWALIIYHVIRRPYHGIAYEWVDKKKQGV
jgi:hypothetical protein